MLDVQSVEYFSLIISEESTPKSWRPRQLVDWIRDCFLKYELERKTEMSRPYKI